MSGSYQVFNSKLNQIWKLALQSVSASGNNTFTGSNIFTSNTEFANITADGATVDLLNITGPLLLDGVSGGAGQILSSTGAFNAPPIWVDTLIPVNIGTINRYSLTVTSVNNVRSLFTFTTSTLLVGTYSAVLDANPNVGDLVVEIGDDGESGLALRTTPYISSTISTDMEDFKVSIPMIFVVNSTPSSIRFFIYRTGTYTANKTVSTQLTCIKIG